MCWIKVGPTTSRYTNNAPLTIAGATVSGTMTFTNFSTGATRLRFWPPPYDVKALDTSLAALAFDDFPLTVI